MLSVVYADCHLYCVSHLSPFWLSVFMLSVVMLNAIRLNVVAPKKVVILSSILTN
jgi:hypothetical protein